LAKTRWRRRGEGSRSLAIVGDADAGRDGAGRGGAGTLSRALKSGGGEEILADGLADPVSVAIDDAFVYFTLRGKDGGSLEDRAVAKVPKAGGAITYIAKGADVSAFGVAVDGTNAYWTQAVTDGLVETACK